MAFWLARERRGQASDWIQRFDPRFWTINFPRPAMASVVTTAPDALRVECEFHHAGELAGLIWDSADTLDHPLAAYATNRDYSRTTLRFRWRSAGVIALDAPHGPTLTIEGRDAAGAERAWFVRLWNYAQGTPEDALIELPFSGLESGFALPGEPVHVADVDRMFISLVPPGYVPDSTDALPARADGWAELSAIECDGARALLEIGDVLVPPHGIGLATAYDDALNQTPARVLRIAEALGYRGPLIHYLGMSHFFRLGADGLALADGTLCEPARAWHRAFFAQAVAHGFEPVASLSFELLADHCPAAWQQRAWDGTPARTGWVPPSALLSPASEPAMAWLRAVATNFVGLMAETGAPVRFQIGEPWWWILHDGRPCLYDDAAKAAMGSAPVEITDMRAPLGESEQALLTTAGELLADATAGLRDAVRAAAPEAQVLLLLFTPTVLDPATPHAQLANLPEAWSHPAYDRLQVEDYDWLTLGAEALGRAAYAAIETRLDYPPERQDYLAGFVLDPADAERLWPKIDAGIEEARRRGVARIFVWAAPQIARDGYIRLPPVEEA